MGFDIVVIGEGEETLIEILYKINNGKKVIETKGIGYIDNRGDYQYTGYRARVDLNNYPPFAVKHNKFGAIEITRGCPFACYFCQTPFIFGGKPRHRSIEQICKYVQIMKDNNLTDIRFITPNAFSYGSLDGKTVEINQIEKMLSSVRKIIKSEGRIFLGSFPSEVRPEHITEETIKLILRYADNDNLVIGAQSGSQRILDLCHRGHTVEDVYRAIKLTINAGLKANVDFIFGLPNEKPEDIKLTIEAMTDFIRMGARIHAHTFMPLPQTPYSNSPPGKIDKETRDIINKLTSKGQIYGEWKKQIHIAENMSSYYKNNKSGGK